MKKVFKDNQTVIMISSIEMKTLEVLQSLSPESLILYEGNDKSPVFKIGVGNSSSLSNTEAIFNSSDERGFAMQVFRFDEPVEDIQRVFNDEYVEAISSINEIEILLEKRFSIWNAVIGIL